mgnify:CR=1 FL=1
MKNFEQKMENAIFFSRWLMAPVYIGLCLSLGMLLYVFFMEFIHVVQNIKTSQSEDIILAILEFIDLSLLGNLVILVVFSGYENFVSHMNIGKHEDRPAWKGTIDFSGLKLKLISSIIAIGSIHLLEVFMGLKESKQTIIWSLTTYGVLVVSGLILSLMDYVSALTKKQKA